MASDATEANGQNMVCSFYYQLNAGFLQGLRRGIAGFVVLITLVCLRAFHCWFSALSNYC